MPTIQKVKIGICKHCGIKKGVPLKEQFMRCPICREVMDLKIKKIEVDEDYMIDDYYAELEGKVRRRWLKDE